MQHPSRREPHDESDIAWIDEDEDPFTIETPPSLNGPTQGLTKDSESIPVWEPEPPDGESVSPVIPLPGPASERPTRKDLEPGDVVAGRYQVKARLEDGYAGPRYHVADRYTREAQVLTVLPPLKNDEAREFFLAFEQIAKMRHAGLVAVYEAAEDTKAGFYYYTEEPESAPTLEDFLRKRLKVWAPEDAVSMVRAVAAAIAPFEHRIHHLNLSPRVLRLRSDGRMRVEGMGLVQALPQVLSAAGLRAGGYQAPELRDPQGIVDQRADVYALGGVLYTLLTGEAPGFRLSPPSYLEEGISPYLDEVVLRCLSPAVEDRYASVSALDSALAKKRRPGLARFVVVATVVLALLGCVGAALAYQRVVDHFAHLTEPATPSAIQQSNAVNPPAPASTASDSSTGSASKPAQAETKPKTPQAPPPAPSLSNQTETVRPSESLKERVTATAELEKSLERADKADVVSGTAMSAPVVPKAQESKPADTNVIPESNAAPELNETGREVLSLPELADDAEAAPNLTTEVGGRTQQPRLEALQPLDQPEIASLDSLDDTTPKRPNSWQQAQTAPMTSVPPRASRAELLAAKNGANGARAKAQAAGAERGAAAIFNEGTAMFRTAESQERASRQGDAATQYRKAQTLFERAAQRATNPAVGMQLSGIVSGEANETPSARIALDMRDGRRQTETFGPGDLVADGWRVEGIDASTNSVTLRNGQLVEVLRGAGPTGTPSRLEARTVQR